MSNPHIRIGLDIDGVLANFAAAFIAFANSIGLGDYFPATYLDIETYDFNNSPKFLEVLAEVSNYPTFWADIEPLPDAVNAVSNLPVKPSLYLTARPIPNDVTEKWLEKHGFPPAPVITVEHPAEKPKVAFQNGITVFVDDLPETVQAMYSYGIGGVLFSQPHNRRANCAPRIASLEQLANHLPLAEEQPAYLAEPGYFQKPPVKTLEQVLSSPSLVDRKDLDEKLAKGGLKLDEGKPRFDLIPYEALEEVARVYTFGAKKYDDNNWRKGMKWGRVFAATIRHLIAFWMGEDCDKETGLPHPAHAAFGCLTLVSYMKSNRDFDDRWRYEHNPADASAKALKPTD